jgi:hypothetical protein
MIRKVRSDLRADRQYGDLFFVDYMSILRGKEIMLEDADESGHYWHGGEPHCYMTEEMLEPIEVIVFDKNSIPTYLPIPPVFKFPLGCMVAHDSDLPNKKMKIIGRGEFESITGAKDNVYFCCSVNSRNWYFEYELHETRG